MANRTPLIIEKEIISSYKDNISAKQISKKYNITSKTVYEILKRNNIDTDKAIKYTSDILEKVKEMYLGGLSIPEIEKLLKIQKGVGYSLLKRTKTKTRPPEESQRKLSYNEKYFDTIDTEEKAYFLGLISADGTIHNSGFKICLEEKDRGILERFKQCIEYNGEIKYIDYSNSAIKRNNQYGIAITNKHLTDSLRKYGIVENKSYFLDFNNSIPNNLLNHYIRGYFDGDGSIFPHYRTKTKIVYGFTMVGTRNFIKKIKEVLEENCNISIYYREQESSKIGFYIGRIECDGEKAMRILDYLYKNSTIYLDRKHKRYLHFKFQ